jgi:hypothetical protein
MKHIFVAEYNGSYTGGSRVWVSTTDDVSLGCGEAELPLVTDQQQNDLYRLSRILYPTYGPSAGIPHEKFVKTVTEMFTGEFLQKVLEAVKFSSGKVHIGFPHNGGFPGYLDGRVRVDWLCTGDFEVQDGLYIVAHYPVSDDIPIGVISDTYYCA